MSLVTTHPFDDDHLQEECAVFGIFGTDEASINTALGLHALQHRGQEDHHQQHQHCRSLHQ